MRKGLALFILAWGLAASGWAHGLTVRSQSDLRLWQTVFDRATPLAWTWEGGADAAIVTFSNRLTRAVSSATCARTKDAARGTCPLPPIAATNEALLAVTLVQTSNAVPIASATADLAFVPSAIGQPFTVRTKAARDWWRVRTPRFAGYDAAWWTVSGPSGYEVMWGEPGGPHRISRTFDGAGEVDAVTLRFGEPGFFMIFR